MSHDRFHCDNSRVLDQFQAGLTMHEDCAHCAEVVLPVNHYTVSLTMVFLLENISVHSSQQSMDFLCAFMMSVLVPSSCEMPVLRGIKFRLASSGLGPTEAGPLWLFCPRFTYSLPVPQECSIIVSHFDATCIFT